MDDEMQRMAERLLMCAAVSVPSRGGTCDPFWRGVSPSGILSLGCFSDFIYTVIVRNPYPGPPSVRDVNT